MRNGDLAKLFPAKPLATRSLTPSGRIGGRNIDALQSGAGIAEVEDANRRIHDYLRDLLAQRCSNPGDDLFSEMMQVEIAVTGSAPKSLFSCPAKWPRQAWTRPARSCP